MTQRRASHIEVPATYASVGASNAPDLMRFPPAGTTPFEDAVRLGSGQDRFTIASSALMTWAAPRGAGLIVDEITVGDGGTYAGIEFDERGTPVTPGAAEQSFGPDGEPFITAGTTARISSSDGKESRSIRVVYVVDDPRRIGLAIGFMDESGAIGESLYCVEHRADDSVWATVRGFLVAPASGLLGIKGRAQLKKAMDGARDQLRALLPVAAIGVETAVEAEAETEAEIVVVAVADTEVPGERAATAKTEAETVEHATDPAGDESSTLDDAN